MNKLLIIAAMVMTSTLNASDQFDEAWGGATLEKWWDAQGRLTGSQFAYHGALNTPIVRLRIASWSPWEGDGAPPFDFEVGRGTVYLWANGEVSGYNWWQWGDGTTKRETFTAEGLASDPFPLKFMRGLYENRDEMGSYRIVGQCYLEVRNHSMETSYHVLNCEWKQLPEDVSKLTEDQFYVKAGELGGVVPALPRGWGYGWIVVEALNGRSK